MELQITLTIKADTAPSVDAVSKFIYKEMYKLMDNKNALITSFRAVEIRSGSQTEITFPNSLDT